MAWIKNTGSKYHTQDTGYYCGAACAMMVLAEIGVNHASLDQDDLYNSNHTHNTQSGWASDPDGVKFTMVNRKPASFTNTFVVYSKPTEAEGSQKLVYTLKQYGVSPIVLVYGCAHWIVVCGVQTNVNPDTGPYSIEGFWVNNPVYEFNEPHSAGDICGSGGSHGIENQWVSYASWQSTYFTGCNWNSTDGALQFLSVCDPNTPKIAMPQKVEPVRYFDGRSIVDSRKIVGALNQEFQRFSLTDSKLTSRVVKGTLAAPLQVRRLDAVDNFYYLFPSMEKNNVVGYTQVNALYGNLESVFTNKRAVKPYEFNIKKLEQQLIGLRIELPQEKGLIRLVKDKFQIEKTLVWRPCRESFSPHLPFWRIVAGPYTFYQRIDGPIFNKLTLDGRGI
ncbi:MAG: hypothetical protein JNK38_25335 [Acidobacteria bacterium]|nr:hypothetical protein [Acidobacteriota bacterium]